MQNNGSNSINWWMVMSGIGCLIIGVYGFHEYDSLYTDLHLTLRDKAYFSLQLFTLESGGLDRAIPVSLEIARWCSPIWVSYAAIKGLLALMHMQSKTYYQLKTITNDHAIICGLSSKGSHIAKGLIKKNYDVVVIDSNPDHPEFNELSELGIKMIVGDALDTVLMTDVKVQSASLLFATTEDDTKNIRISANAINIINESYFLKKDKSFNTFIRYLVNIFSNEKIYSKLELNCYVNVSDQTTKSLFYKNPLFSRSSKRFNAQMFNLYDRGARIIFDDYAPDKNRSILSINDAPISICIFGFSSLSRSLVIHIAHTAHYANNKKIKITIIDKLAKDKINSIKLSVPEIEKFIDFRTITASLDCMDISYLDDVFSSKVDTVYVMTEDDIQAFSIAQSLVSYAKRNCTVRLPIVVGLMQVNPSSELLYKEGHAFIDGISVFPLITKTSDADVVMGNSHDEIAKRIHEFYVKSKQTEGASVNSDTSMKSWDELTEDMKDSNRGLADHFFIKKRALGRTDKEITNASDFNMPEDKIDTLASMEHKRWMAGKLMEGWVYASGEKCPDLKTSPLLIDYSMLSDDDKKYNREMIRGMTKLVAQLKSK